MRLRILLALLLGVTLLAAAARADDFGLTPRGMFDGLPAGFVNVARQEFGHNLIIPGDYGLGNIVKVEEWQRGNRHQVRLFRTPELRVSHTRPAKMEVLAGNVKMLYVWIETPPMQGSWRVTIDEQYFDGTSEQVFSKEMKPGVRNFFDLQPNTRLHITVSTKTTAVKVPMRFILTLSPVMYAVFPDLLPEPHRTIFE
jgi:hypothetical protein